VLISVGSVIGKRYRLLGKLGQGGMGSVWRAEHIELLTHVAIKLMDPEIAASTEAAARFKREARAAASLHTKHVVQVLDYGVDDGLPYIAMELLEGEDLAARLRRVGRLPASELFALLVQAGKAIGQAHERGIIHRDLKPANLFITRDSDTGEDLVKVLDFGIAKAQSPLGSTCMPETRTGALLGTPYYMSPEQMSGRGRVDARTDVWALAVIAFEALLGRRPFDAETVQELTLVVCTDPLPVPSQLGPVPRGFDEWFLRAGARDLGARFESIDAALDALRRVCTAAPAHPSVGQSVRSAGDSDQRPVASVPETHDTQASDTTHAPASVTVGPGVASKRRSLRLLAAALVGASALVSVLVLVLARREHAVPPAPEQPIRAAARRSADPPRSADRPMVLPSPNATQPLEVAETPHATVVAPAETAADDRAAVAADRGLRSAQRVPQAATAAAAGRVSAISPRSAKKAAAVQQTSGMSSSVSAAAVADGAGKSEQERQRELDQKRRRELAEKLGVVE
jgi:eukaryotic-like serine/threonine-protein kinase